jgi:hypothetical protein
LKLQVCKFAEGRSLQKEFAEGQQMDLALEEGLGNRRQQMGQQMDSTGRTWHWKDLGAACYGASSFVKLGIPTCVSCCVISFCLFVRDMSTMYNISDIYQADPKSRSLMLKAGMPQDQFQHGRNRKEVKVSCISFFQEVELRPSRWLSSGVTGAMEVSG